MLPLGYELGRTGRSSPLSEKKKILVRHQVYMQSVQGRQQNSPLCGPRVPYLLHKLLYLGSILNEYLPLFLPTGQTGGGQSFQLVGFMIEKGMFSSVGGGRTCSSGLSDAASRKMAEGH